VGSTSTISLGKVNNHKKTTTTHALKAIKIALFLKIKPLASHIQIELKQNNKQKTCNKFNIN
jgi:hypothetical protein